MGCHPSLFNPDSNVFVIGSFISVKLIVVANFCQSPRGILGMIRVGNIGARREHWSSSVMLEIKLEKQDREVSGGGFEEE